MLIVAIGQLATGAMIVLAIATTIEK
jgi:hypothetical protein